MFKLAYFMRLLVVFLLLSLSTEIHSQDVTDIESNEELIKELVKSQIESKNDKQIVIEDNLTQLNKDIKEESLDKEDEKVFGFNFFNNVINKDNKAPVLDIPLQSDYMISFNDELELLLTGNQDKVIQLRADLSGNISIPELGSFSVVNLTLEQANKKIAEIISNSYIDTKSYLSVKKPSLKKVSVIGMVKNPGTYLMNPFISISEAIKYAGGLEDNASLRKIIIRDFKGNAKQYDLYNFLVYGDRSKDVNLRNGDTVIVSASTLFVEISGSVQRPLIYEYTEQDTFQNLIDFSQGLASRSNKDNITANYYSNNSLLSKSISLEEYVGEDELQSIFVGNLSTISNKRLYVNGRGATNGYYDFQKGQKLSDTLVKLAFSDNIYPFFGILKQTSLSGLAEESVYFSLADIDTYKDIVLNDNPEILFFSREDIALISKNEEELNNSELISYRETLLEKVDEVLIKEISVGKNRYRFPMVGKFKARSVLNYIGYNSLVQEDKTIIIGVNNLLSDDLESYLDSKDVLLISFPSIQENLISVNIEGQVNSPGFYTVPSNTSINDLYRIAGGVKDQSDMKSVYVSREAVKQREEEAVKSSRKILTDLLISQIGNPINNSISSAATLDISSILSLSEEIEFTGRVSGNFEINSDSAKNFFLQNGDTVFIPSPPNTVSVIGEVLNPITVTYKEGLNYKDYLSIAGGLNDFSDKNNMYIIKSNGEATPVSRNIFSGGVTKIEAGDTIVIPRNMDKVSPLPLASLATKIIADIAFAAASINAIQN